MAIPDFQTLMLPVLRFAANGEAPIRDAVGKLADEFGLSAEEREQKLPKGGSRTFANRVYWARSYLGLAGLVEGRGKGRFAITESGRATLAKNPHRIDLNFLKQFPQYVEWRSGKASDSRSDSAEGSDTEAPSQTPEELLKQTFVQMEDALRAELLDRILNLSPAFFETLIVKLFGSIYGDEDREDALHRIGKGGDGGIDGIIEQDALGLERIYLQAKRYAKDSPVSEQEIRGFAGALDAERATKGIFVTTSRFTGNARNFVSRIGRKIVLVDGLDLTRLMVKYRIGTGVKQTLMLSKIDEDFFDETI